MPSVVQAQSYGCTAKNCWPVRVLGSVAIQHDAGECTPRVLLCAHYPGFLFWPVCSSILGKRWV